MLPKVSVDVSEEAGKRMPTKAFRIDFDEKKVGGIIDGEEALKQAIYVALMTERYKYAVFSHYYGTDYRDAFSEGYVEAMGKVRYAVEDSLKYDDRILSVGDFAFEKRGKAMCVSFKVRSVYGELDFETEV